MDIANKKRTYAWGFSRTILGKEATRLLCFDVSGSLYNKASLLFFWFARK